MYGVNRMGRGVLACIIAGLVTMGAAAPKIHAACSSPNLLEGSNWSFEQSGSSEAPWDDTGNFFVVNMPFAQARGARDGANSVGYSKGPTGFEAHELWFTATVTPGKTYRVSTWAFVWGADGSSTARLEWNNGGYPGIAGGTQIGSAVTWSAPNAASGWTEISGNVTPTGSQLTMILRAEVNSGGTGAAVHFDACFIVDTAAPPAPIAGTNLIQNPGFESSFANWSNPGGYLDTGTYPNPCTGPGIGHGGVKWAHTSYSAIASYVGREVFQTVSVTPGIPYRLSVYVDILGADEGLGSGKLLWYDGAYPGPGNGCLLDNRFWQWPSSQICWTEMSGIVTPTTDTLTFILRADLNGVFSPPGGVGLGFDTCSVVAQVAATPTPTNTPVPTNTPLPGTPTATPLPPTPTPTPTISTQVRPEAWSRYR